MLKLNIETLLKSRGIDNASRYLVQKGMKYHTVNRLLTGKVVNVSYDTLEQLCVVCVCSLDDLFVWHKTTEGLPDDHPLYKLKPKEAVANPVDRIKGLSLKKLEKLREFMDGLEKE
jgi:DNA-binding Xre family transcriptional regulator